MYINFVFYIVLYVAFLLVKCCHPALYRRHCTNFFCNCNCVKISYGTTCLGGAAVRRRTHDRKVAGSTPGQGTIKSTRSTQPSIPPG